MPTPPPFARVLLLGAGASQPADLPLTSELGGLIEDELGSGSLYSRWRSRLPTHLRDFESVASILQAIASGDTPLVFAVAQVIANVDLEVQSDLDAGRASSELIQLRQVLVNQLWLPGDDATPDPRCSYLAQVVKNHEKYTIFTLNYDNTLRRCGAPVRYAKGRPREHVGIPSSGASAMYEDRDELHGDPSQSELESRGPRVLPLHGYLGWHHKHDETRNIDEVVFPRTIEDVTGPIHVPAVVFGVQNKLRHYSPFLAMLSEFQTHLHSVSEVVTIGYSWRDAHINHMLRQWAASRADANLPMSTGRLVVVNQSGEMPQAVRHIDNDLDQAVTVSLIGGGIKGFIGSDELVPTEIRWQNEVYGKQT